MDPTDARRRIEELFDAALDLGEEERERWLAGLTGGDEELRPELERLLAAHRRSGGILDAMGIPESDIADYIQGALGQRYEIIRELGRGGMAVVFLAWERKHDRRVVLKVLKPRVAVLYGAERFQQEVRLAGQLSHPHILGLIDSGEAAGLLYYVMPHVEGETLGERMAGEEPVPLAEGLTLLGDVASALAHAHDRGVVHRDLKPDNVLCAGSHAYLMDFGVAKSFVPGEEGEPITRTGLAIGTPRYMAPEQAAGLPGLDHRVDVYAWGLLAYELLTGRPRAFSLEGLDTSGAGASSVAEEIRLARSEAPDWLCELVGHCLEMHPARRCPSAEAILEGLGGTSTRTAAPRRVGRPALGWIAAAVLVVVVVAAWLWTRRPVDAPSSVLPVPVVVAEFANETGDDSLDVLGRLAGDWLTQGLQQTGLIAVVPWPTALQASRVARARTAERPDTDPVRVLRDETGAGSVVTGSYYLVGDRIRFRAEIVDAREGAILSAPDPVEAPIDSAAAAIRELRERMMSALAIRADERLASNPALARRPPTYEAYRSFDRGVGLYLDQEYDESARAFLRAHELDATFDEALLLAGASLWNASRFARLDSTLALLEARRPRLNEYQELRLQMLVALMSGDGRAGLEAARRASELAPQSRTSYNVALAALGLNRPREALAALEQLDPDAGTMRDWGPYWSNLTHALHLLGRHQRELEAAREMRRRFPERRVGLVLEVRALAALGETGGIDEALARSAALAPTTYWSQGAAMVVAGEELRAHGHEGGPGYLDRGIAWLREHLRSDPDYRPHRYWLASALYDAERWEDAGAVAKRLAEDYPDRPAYRELAVLAAARLGQPAAPEELLAEVPARERGTRLAVLARLEAIRGNHELAISHLADAFDAGVDGVPWLHATAYLDLLPLADDPRYRSLMMGDAAP